MVLLQITNGGKVRLAYTAPGGAHTLTAYDALGRAVVVQSIGDEQARDYLIAHLDEKGGDLYARLDERLRHMARVPLILWLIKEAGAWRIISEKTI